MVSVEFEYIKYSLRIALIVLACYGRLGEQLAPLFGHAGEGARDGIESNMYFVDEIGRVAHAAEGTS
jgi:hypothetical protein